MGIAVVTGASAGIGRATALAFAAEGWDVALISRNEARLGLLRAETERSGRNALALPLDVAVATDVEAAATRIEEKLGPIEVWVSNAMVSVFSPVHEMSPAEFRRVTEVIYPGFCFTRCASAGCANTRNGCAARCGTSSRTAAFASTTTVYRRGTRRARLHLVRPPHRYGLAARRIGRGYLRQCRTRRPSSRPASRRS